MDNFERLAEQIGSIQVDVFGNRLDFGSLEPTHQLLGEFLFSYDSQAVIGTPLDTTILRGVDLPLFISTAGNQNTYQWYFNNQPIASATDSLYRISGMNYADTGVYFCEIRNEIADKTALRTYEMRVNITDPISERDSLNLVKFYLVTGGDNWINPWQLKNPVISWKGLVFKNNKLVEINLAENRLTGQIPDFMDTAAVFRNIVSLNLSANYLSGTIPESLGKLESLILLDLDKNKLAGKIPDSFTQLPNLRTLWISRNEFTHFPQRIHDWKNLQYLFAHQNQIQEIPASFAQLGELRVLNLNDNQLLSIPNHVAGLSKLETFYVARNQIHEIYPEIGKLPALKLLDMTDNQLVSLPFSMASFQVMEQLKVGKNQLQFGALENLIGKYIVFEYVPQANIGETQEFSLNTGDTFEVSITVSGTNNRYQWYRDAQPISGAIQPTFRIENIQNMDVGIYYCLVNNTKAKELTIRNLPITLNITCGDGLTLELTTDDPLIYCPEAEIITKLTAAVSQEDIQIRWFRDNVQLYGTNGLSFFAQNPGVYHARITDSNGCSVNSNTIAIQTHPERYADIRSDSTALYLYETNTEVVDYQWYYYDQLIEGATRSSYQADKDGIYVLQITDKNGCQAFSNTVRLTNTALEEAIFEQVKVYPNPVRDFFYVGTPLSLGEVRIHIFSVNGQEMTNIHISEHRHHEKRLDIRQLPAGVYVLTIATDEGDIIRRIVKP